MTLLDYLKDRIFPLIVHFLVLLFTGFSLSVFNLDPPLVFYILLLYLMAVLLIFLFDYFTRFRYYVKIAEKLKNLDKKYLICELIDYPTMNENRIVYDFLRITNKSMNDEINHYKRDSEEYREYIETWVHEIKTPIASAKLLIENNPTSATLSIGEEIDHVGTYVNQALFYSRSNGVEKDYIIKKVTLENLVNPVIRNHAKIFIQKKIKLTTKNLTIDVLTDSKWTDFIIGQILDNALKYVMTNDPSKVPSIAISGKHENHSALLSISDNGIGISQGDLKNIFEKGFTGTNGRIKKCNATGIGLYLCKKLCIKMGLDLTLSSELNSGTTVTITFPIPKDPVM
ncbi:MAG: HAMP domain-containing sensor histidine kinase [Eubacterium sp.]